VLYPLQLIPEYRPYIWGGHRLRPGPERTAEAWVVYEHDRITAGPLAGRTLGEAAAEYGSELVGSRAVQRTGARFPLLVKLLDCAEWLSLQVHPNDEQAIQLAGAREYGKTEAWHFIEAEPGAEILCGLRPGTTRERLVQAIRNGTIVELMKRFAIHAGDSIFISPGMIHALGPGLLLYEVQQTSDLTYRVYDWDRPQTPNRQLHIEQSLIVADLNADSQLMPRPPLVDGHQQQPLVTCRYFTLELLAADSDSITLDTHGESFHALTLIEGEAELEWTDRRLPLHRFDTVLMPASCGAYRLGSSGFFRALKSAA
jgi:mannose-6-phosphate isomerase